MDIISYIACLLVGICIGYFVAAMMFLSRQMDDIESIVKDIEGDKK